MIRVVFSDYALRHSLKGFERTFLVSQCWEVLSLESLILS
jgi:hypothetical protein